MAFKFLQSFKRASNDHTCDAPVDSWRSVEVLCGSDPCKPARAAQGTRYLAAEAPFLPLRDCDRSANCGCRYRHYSDRRAGPRRDADVGFRSSVFSDQPKRRSNEGRRKDDADFSEDELLELLDDTFYGQARKPKR